MTVFGTVSKPSGSCLMIYNSKFERIKNSFNSIFGTFHIILQISTTSEFACKSYGRFLNTSKASLRNVAHSEKKKAIVE